MPTPMTERDVARFAEWIAGVSGVRLDATKRYLLESRLDPVLREGRCGSWDELYLRARKERPLERLVIEALTTNETFFFRDLKTFELLKHKLVPELLGADLKTPVSIWSAACSTGQEAYSLAMVLEEILFDLARCRIRILGTDINETVVSAANRAEFTPLEMTRGLVNKQVERYFVKSPRGYKVRDDLRSLCRFSVDNLLKPTTLGPFDVVLCRNVLIYFSPEDKARVVANLVSRTKKGGVLLVGSMEALTGLHDRLERRVFHGANYYVVR